MFNPREELHLQHPRAFVVHTASILLEIKVSPQSTLKNGYLRHGAPPGLASGRRRSATAWFYLRLGKLSPVITNCKRKKCTNFGSERSRTFAGACGGFSCGRAVLLVQNNPLSRALPVSHDPFAPPPPKVHSPHTDEPFYYKELQTINEPLFLISTSCRPQEE